jgi:hypothetical protein
MSFVDLMSRPKWTYDHFRGIGSGAILKSNLSTFVTASAAKPSSLSGRILDRRVASLFAMTVLPA